MCDSLHPFRVHANHLTTTKTDRYGLMVRIHFSHFPVRSSACRGFLCPGRPFPGFALANLRRSPHLKDLAGGKPYPGAASATPPSFPNRSFRQERPNALPSESGSSGGHNNLKSIFKMERKIYDFRGVKVSLRKESYRTNGTLAVIMDEVESGDEYAVMTVNLCSPMQDGSRLAFVDTNNIEGIDKWLVGQGLATHAGVLASSGFCTYPLMSFNTENF